MATDRFDDLALSMFPVGYHTPGVLTIRKEVAKVMRDVYAQARREQLEEKFPELEKARKDVDLRRSQADALIMLQRARAEDAEDLKTALNEREAKLFAREQALKEFLIALDDYEAWQNGDGEVDDIAARYRALRDAYKAYKERTGTK